MSEEDFTDTKMFRWLMRSVKCLGANLILYFAVFVVLPVIMATASPGDCVRAFYIFMPPVVLFAGFGFIAAMLTIFYAFKIPVGGEGKRVGLSFLAMLLLAVHAFFFGMTILFLDINNFG